jgi:hypothetical protein
VTDVRILKPASGITPTLGAHLTTKSYVDTADALLIPLTQRGAANGVATLDGSSQIPVAQLPAAVPRGLVAAPSRLTTDSATFAATEVMLWQFTFTAVSGRRYSFKINSGINALTASTVQMRLRWATGASVTTAGTQIWSEKRRCVADAFERWVSETSATGLTAGQVTVGISGINLDGAVTSKLLGAADNIREFTIADAGV